VNGSLRLEVEVPSPEGVDGQLVGPPGLAEVVDVCVTKVVDDDEGRGVVVGGFVEPGRHCEYQSFWYVQVQPETQVVAPVQPIPPHWPQPLCWAAAADARRMTDFFILSKALDGSDVIERCRYRMKASGKEATRVLRSRIPRVSQLSDRNLVSNLVL